LKRLRTPAQHDVPPHTIFYPHHTGIRSQMLCRELAVLAAAKLFYFQQQVNAGAACSATSKTFALGN